MQARESPLPGLYWVEAEFEQSFKRARALIEQAIENPGERAGLHQAAVELHQVAGTATMVQSHAVATLAGEMHRALSDLAEDRLADRESAQAAVLGALVQIADYVDGLSAGSPDSVLILQPAINELRVVRGQAVFTEAELFAGHLATLDLAAVPPPSEARRAGAAQRRLGLDMMDNIFVVADSVFGPGEEAVLGQLEALFVLVVDHAVRDWVWVRGASTVTKARWERSIAFRPARNRAA